MVEIADSLADFLLTKRILDPRELAIIETHIAALTSAAKTGPAFAISDEGSKIISALEKLTTQNTD